MNPASAPSLGLYIHVPFCQAKCAYCDFASVAGRAELFAGYTAAVCDELRRRPGLLAGDAGRSFSVETLYIGGGTPSILPAPLMQTILQTVRAAYPLTADAEITVEVNPGATDAAGLTALRDAGVNRLSVGVQSFDDAELHLLGRIHDRRRARETLEAARRAGFDNLNLDLIFGLPGQNMAVWEASLTTALDVGPEHLSLYALTVEEHTPLARRIAAGALPPPDEDLAADMYLRASELLASAGYAQYEISNWAKPGRAARHNLATWRNGDYLGFGPAAHSHLSRRRWWNVADPQDYIARMVAGVSPMDGEEQLDRSADMAETMLLGLRLVREGVEIGRFMAIYGETPAQVYGPIFERLVGRGLLELTAERIRLTPAGRLLGNQVFMEFLP